MRKINWPFAFTRLTAHVRYGLMPNLVICKHGKEYGIHDTECPYLDQVSLNNTKLQTPNHLIHIWPNCRYLLGDVVTAPNTHILLQVGEE